MKKVEAMIRAERMPVVKEKLRQMKIGGMTISTVSGWSKQRELHLQWRGQPVAYDLLPRVKFEIVLPDGQVDKVVQAVIKSPDPTPISRARLPLYCLMQSARRNVSSDGAYI